MTLTDCIIYFKIHIILKDLLEALKTLSAFFPENSIRSRRNLRSDIEKRSLTLNEEFLVAFRNVKEQLDEICGSIGSMSECSDNMLSRLKVKMNHFRF